MYKLRAYFPESEEIWESKIFVTLERAERHLDRHFMPMIYKHIEWLGIPGPELTIIRL